MRSVLISCAGGKGIRFQGMTQNFPRKFEDRISFYLAAAVTASPGLFMKVDGRTVFSADDSAGFSMIPTNEEFGILAETLPSCHQDLYIIGIVRRALTSPLRGIARACSR